MAPTTSRTITLDDLTPQNIGVLKKLNTVLFPVPYSDKFYKESLTVGELAKLGSLPKKQSKSNCPLVFRQWLMISLFQRRLCWSSAMSI
jgi:hypothetical protein